MPRGQDWQSRDCKNLHSSYFSVVPTNSGFFFNTDIIQIDTPTDLTYKTGY
jgi:hypothetical protein